MKEKRMFIAAHAHQQAERRDLDMPFPKLALRFGKRAGGANARTFLDVTYAYSLNGDTLKTVYRAGMSPYPFIFAVAGVAWAALILAAI